MSGPGRLDPDALAALEEERRFLLRSLDDLDAELEAGDIDREDYDGLRDDYTRRAAEVMRAIDARRAAFAATPRLRWRQALVWLVGVAVLGGISGLLIARTSGTRSASDEITGGVRASSVSLLNEARALFGDRERWDEAIEVYDEVLAADPSNVEALTYRAWLSYRLGEGDVGAGALAGLEEASRIDPGYPDAIVFRAVILADAGRYDEAADAFEALDREGAPAAVLDVVAQRGLAGEVYGESRYPRLTGAGEPSLDELDLSVDDALAAAGYLLGTDREDRSIVALKLYRAVQAAEPDNPAALSREAFLLAQTGDPELVARAMVLADRAVDANADDAEARLTRAILSVGSDPEAACADLAALAALDDVAPPIADRADTLAATHCA